MINFHFQPKPKYLANVKNPCWREDSGKGEMKCLPYFHILGVAKAGTTDLWNRLMGHPHVVSNNGFLHKEALWWGWTRYGQFKSLFSIISYYIILRYI